MNRSLGLMAFFLCFISFSYSQERQDTVIVKNDTLKATVADTSAPAVKDSVTKKRHSPRTAAIRSAILPGLGQAYNRKYWKIPIVYGVLGTTAGVFNFNLSQYKRINFAYKILVSRDTARFNDVDDDLQPFLEQNASAALRNYRNEYRRNIDYSVLVFLLFWGLNVVDATVDAHLKGFDVGTDLSLKIKPGYNPNSNTTGISLVFDIHKGKPKLFPIHD